MDHDSLRLHAATLLRAPKVTGREPVPTGSAVDASEQPAPAFVKATANQNRNTSRTTKVKGKGKEKEKENPPDVAPDNATGSILVNHTTMTPIPNLGTLSAPPVQTSNFTIAALIPNHSTSSAPPAPASRFPVAFSNTASSTLPLPASTIQDSGHVASVVHLSQACSIPMYPAPVHYYGPSASSSPPALPGSFVVSSPIHYYSIPPHPSVPSYYSTVHPYAPTSLQVLSGQEGYHRVRPADLHQPISTPTLGAFTVPQPGNNVPLDFPYHQWSQQF